MTVDNLCSALTIKLFASFLTIALMWPGTCPKAADREDTCAHSATLVAAQSVAMDPVASGALGRNALIDVRDYGITGDGRTNDTLAMSTLLTTVGSSPARLIFPPGLPTLLGTISFPANVTLDFSGGGALEPVTGQRITILGRIIGTTQQIF